MDNLIHDALSTYFQILRKTGEVKEEQSYKVVLILFIKKLLDTNKQHYYSEDQLQIIKNTLIRLTKSTCFLPCNNRIMKAVNKYLSLP